MSERDYDDAIHIAAPWNTGGVMTLCGQRDRMNVAKYGPWKPDGWSGCWTCLLATAWLDEHAAQSREAVSAHSERTA